MEERPYTKKTQTDKLGVYIYTARSSWTKQSCEQQSAVESN